MSTASVTPSFYADFSGLEGLKAGARSQQKDAVHEAARQFESLLTRMMLKSMREASLGQGLGDSEETSFYQDMFDQQLAVQMSKGAGLGLASQLMQQLVKAGAVKGADAPSGAGATAMPVTTPATDAARATFIESIRPQATQAAVRLGVAPEAVIAHAALESGWGQHLPSDTHGSSFNLFGIKATGPNAGSAVQALTTEFRGGKADRLNQGFRRYDSLQAGVADYAALLTSNDRYAAALNTGNDVHAFAVGLQQGGYATDPDYVQKLTTTAASVKHYLDSPGLKNVTKASISGSGRNI
jgi:flagellar protein FlgJ